MNPEPGVRHAWDTGQRRWDAYFAVILAGTLALIQVTGTPAGHGRLVASAALVAMAPWYVLLGRRAIYGPGESLWPGAIYQGGLIALLAIAEAGANAGSVAFILLALGPQAFMASRSYRQAVVVVVLLNAPVVLTALADGARGSDLAAPVTVAGLSTVFSVVFGGWINRIIDQSRQRADLIEQLERTRAELAEANREAGRLAERDRLASEIHDTIAQGFTSIVMLVQAAEALLGETSTGEAVFGDNGDRVRKQLDLIGRTARENLAEARALVAGLTPTALASAPLEDALARLADRAAEESGLRADFGVLGTPRPVGTRAEVVLLRVCQEALANVRRHAAATRVAVTLGYTDEHVALAVTDDGAGFDPNQPTSGYGLRGMRARVHEIGGALTVTSAAGTGTTVTAEVP
ncbi:MAG TPA: sensor histidine kinase [Streptosporangiaceae bacterium]